MFKAFPCQQLVPHMLKYIFHIYNTREHLQHVQKVPKYYPTSTNNNAIISNAAVPEERHRPQVSALTSRNILQQVAAIMQYIGTAAMSCGSLSAYSPRHNINQRSAPTGSWLLAPTQRSKASGLTLEATSLPREQRWERAMAGARCKPATKLNSPRKP